MDGDKEKGSLQKLYKEKNIFYNEIINMNYLKSFTKLIREKKGLLKCIFTTLLFQILVTTLAFIGVYRTGKNESKENNISSLSLTTVLAFLAIAIGLIILMTSFDFTFNERVSLFTMFSVMQGIFLGVCLKFVDANIIFTALLSTIVLFVLMILVGFGIVYLKYDLSWLGLILFLSLLGLIIVRIIDFFIPYTRKVNKLLSIFAILLFSIYIIYDTNVILFRYSAIKYERDCILGALDYYLDLLNIFVNMNNTM
jgi:hypothetical protein